MPDISAIKNAPDISFIDGRTIDDIRGEMVADFERYMTEATGKPVSLARASVHRMEIYAATAQIYQAMQYIDRAGKQNLLKYSYSDYLDNVALLKGITREPAKAATTTLRFTLSAERTTVTGIPQGTRVSTVGAIYFQTTEYREIQAGEMTVDVPAICTVPGIEGNDLEPGELRILVDPIPYTDSVANIYTTEGGAEIESDEELAERAYLAPGSYSTAGPAGAYEYWVKAYNQAIGDVKICSDQQAGTVDVYFLMDDGAEPGEEMIRGLEEYLRTGDMRPMDDLVNVAAPEAVPYSVNFKYWINRSDAAMATTIQAAVEAAVAKYLEWQRHIGRDINPSKLVQMVMAAGAKCVEITAPQRTAVAGAAVAGITETPTIIYGGLEDD